MDKKTFRVVSVYGRIIIPKAIRTELGIEIGDELEVKVVDGDVVFSKVRSEEAEQPNYCPNCGSKNSEVDNGKASNKK